MKSANPEQQLLKVLFLSGGMSQRMGSDKALLEYSGMTELKRWQQVFQRLGLPFYWSQRPDQYPKHFQADILRLEDTKPGAGPLAALLSAHESDRDAAWLLLACDWPLLGEADMQKLVRERDPSLSASVYRVEEHIEPLCGIYEAHFLRGLEQAFNAGELSLYRMLSRVLLKLIDPLEPRLFLNANDAKARQAAALQLTAYIDHRV